MITKLLGAERNREPAFGGPADADGDLATALDPTWWADSSEKARGRYLFTSAAVREQIEERHRRMIEDLAATSPEGFMRLPSVLETSLIPFVPSYLRKLPPNCHHTA